MPEEKWLELNEAAQLLGIHPSTLRRWADAGKLPYIRTLSGRRRFSLSALQQAQSEMQHSPVTPEQEAPLESKTLDLTRQRTSDLSAYPGTWITRLNDDQKMFFKYSGQRLLGLLIQYISRSEGNEVFLEEGKRVAQDYGQVCFKAGLTIAQTAEAFLFFRRTLLESVQDTTRLNGPHDRNSQGVFLRTIDFFDSLLIATIESYANMSSA
jgi:excisionase family DNA binding protein